MISATLSPLRHIPRLTVAWSAVLLLACGGRSESEPPGAEGEAAAPGPAEVNLPDRTEFVERGLATAAGSRAELQASLGAADSIAAEVVPNRHVPGVLDTIYTVHYQDLVAILHHPGGGGDLLSMVQVSSNRHLRYPVIGADAQTIDRAFGRPDEASDSSLTYYCTSCQAGNDPVQLVVEDGEVRRVRFNFYVD